MSFNLWLIVIDCNVPRMTDFIEVGKKCYLIFLLPCDSSRRDVSHLAAVTLLALLPVCPPQEGLI